METIVKETAIKTTADKIIENVEKIIIGKKETIKLILCALFSEGHVLIEDVPGVGKTALAKSFAKSFNSSYSRIQCTPDLLPTDILGTNIYNPKTGDFTFRPGPISNNIILVDEINRANPKTQSALLECMEEYQVSTDGTTISLPRPFMILATQNPIEYDGTFLLPEAQLDRFFLKCHIGYPDFESEADMLQRSNAFVAVENLQSVSSLEKLREIQQQIKQIKVEDSIRDYIVNIVQATREDPVFLIGASPRGSIALYKASQAYAAINGRDYVIPEDVKYMSVHVLKHRVKSAGSYLKDQTNDTLINNTVSSIKIPL